jgi:dihydrodipicolinate synthase/N-acetylneuraminate lyase
VTATDRTPPPVIEGRTIRGASAVLLPMTPDGTIDWPGYEAHLARTVAAGLTPAVNMDTGFGPYLDDAGRARVLRMAVALGGEVIAGVHSDDEPGDAFDLDALVAAASAVRDAGALPILFPGHGMAGLSDDELVEVHRRIGERVGPFLGFELGPMFHPAGRVFSTRVFEGLLEIQEVVGLKHSSLRRDLEWERLRLCQRHRPDFRMMTGNDLAIDLVVHGSDYLLGLSTFAPDAFAARDAAWTAGDQARFWELNDVLQYLGQFAFRPPVPAYRHDAAMFLELRGWASSHATHPRSPVRADSDVEVLAEIAERVEALLHG